jgi:tRNA (guanosine-2'-O-)-methyltransferase
MYDIQQLTEQTCQKVLFEGGFPRLMEICDRKALPYPRIDENGYIDEDETWWQQIRFSKKS